jgi:hypothetical protein
MLLQGGLVVVAIDPSRASALGMDTVKTGHFAQILGRKALKKHLSSGVNLPFFAISK